MQDPTAGKKNKEVNSQSRKAMAQSNNLSYECPIFCRIRRRAEISSYFDRHDEAENMLREIDRKDLTISLRERLGDWFRVVQVQAAPPEREC